MTVPPAPPPLPASVRKALRGFTQEQVEQARETLAGLARGCPDPEIRKEAAEYIEKAARADADRYFDGEPDALVALASLPLEQQTSAAMQLFAQGKIARVDLDTILKSVQADQTTRIAQLEKDKQLLERENKDYAARLEGKNIDGTPLRAQIQ